MSEERIAELERLVELLKTRCLRLELTLMRMKKP